MSLSLYDVSVPVFIRGLQNLSAILEKGRAWANDKDMAHTSLLNARLFEDMAPLTAQIQRASDTAKFAVVRVAQIEGVAMADDEQSFDELQNRITRTIAFLETVPAQSMDGRDEAKVVLPTPHGAMTFTGRNYLLSFALPNFFFHVTTAYAILRHEGVPVGKLDYIGSA
ncbi:DUF1993 domain-containing protein [Sphingobium sp. SCG-1]|uniref:DUF1993 domain-containing protein n=1 Tax=Sphingobium sp. SCG-1 TaxID=2072936 RepID=UPI000CD693E8|nr:DUF1993 domain-containing protein [Sphingobium sp. SCG-1]AUW59281.1 DUF1993 domain-containing protein [Sphingobium sp. SCG-1]